MWYLNVIIDLLFRASKSRAQNAAEFSTFKGPVQLLASKALTLSQFESPLRMLSKLWILKISPPQHTWKWTTPFLGPIFGFMIIRRRASALEQLSTSRKGGVHANAPRIGQM